ncbi:MAG: BspA family leucine-rich repeat surface protein, partial [Defluviitaleaceae bacterium]|nr:BspA family leucine-rich repeat surface protein [Defluviitaleaceae bacterium]
TPPPTSPPIHTGTLTTAPWRIYPDGTLAISPGSITWPAAQSPWHNYREIITQVVIEGPITAGPSLRGLFAHLANVTEITGLNYLDTTAVTNMRGMFNGARSLAHLDVSTWDTSNVTDMEALFHDTAITTLDVSGWDISRVTTMNRMFQRTPNLTALDVSRWDTGNVTDMTGVFDGATSLTALDISNWDTSNVVQMRRMFTDTRGIATLDVSRWDVGSVETMEGMFSGAGVTALDLSRWDTGNVRSMSTMFTDTAIASLDLSSWNTANVTTMNRMFQRMANLETLNISGFDTGNVRDMFQMFSNASALRLLSLGESFRFVENGGAIMLRAGIWGNVGGVYTLTTPELMMRHNASPALETWIIQ